jgi:superfamily II DNA or RNA helicase
MMTTGYDCPDILNLGLMRPIFSPTDFIQIKGRGTRKHDFLRTAFRRRPQGPDRQAAAQDRLQAVRLLRQLRILRGRSSTTTKC